MSIDPVTASTVTPRSDGLHARVVELPQTGKVNPVPSTANSSKPEEKDLMNGFSSSEQAEDAVQVQRDTSTGAIVIKYLDRAGNVVLQVPSSEVLALARAIQQDLNGGAKLHRIDSLRSLDEEGNHR